jgi:hypothetical protein
MVSQKKRRGKAATETIPTHDHLAWQTLRKELFSSAASLLPQMRGRGRRSVLLHMSRPMTMQMLC